MKDHNFNPAKHKFGYLIAVVADIFGEGFTTNDLMPYITYIYGLKSSINTNARVNYHLKKMGYKADRRNKYYKG